MRKKSAPVIAVLVALVVAGCEEVEGLEQIDMRNTERCERQLTEEATPEFLSRKWGIDPNRSIAIAAEISYFCQSPKKGSVEKAADFVGLQLKEKGYAD